ncbi:betaine/proline/choline family ABC transporter ATP-binding protein [Aestuariivita sp.]|jgi:glycine betaine/proline transport system ATP-binding protein|uniref:quaternary amine ABC transporter ATP-binding protein n=1 Tax=Aestuariivita sp. TaxID=1872407 RepID=UPI00216FC9EE|nr:betaine/proline/choline family ABC transporter ATP-binding protein [Aestuariivita sp.]MCE8006999.1 betaine/proline/choline family ABC transporter ATP-binding protein [Aestuariivita sp.]
MPLDAAIELRNVWKIFGSTNGSILEEIRSGNISKAEALERHNCVIGVADVSLSIAEGELFCVMGLSGSGKSTLVRHINRLLEPTFGEIHVAGDAITDLDAAALRRFRNEHIAMVFQNFALMPHRTVLDNVALPLAIRGLAQNHQLARARAALKMVELAEWADKFAYELSGGMQQRVGLARAIAADSEVLLMDEPFSALDPLIRRQLQDEFMKLASIMSKTTVFITHDLEEAVRIGDRIAIMRDGGVVQIGTPEDIVMAPADDYVRDFVSGISRLKIVRASALMTDIDIWAEHHGALPTDALQMPADAKLEEVIKASAHTDGPIIVHNDGEMPVGIITKSDLLEAVIDGDST